MSPQARRNLEEAKRLLMHVENDVAAELVARTRWVPKAKQLAIELGAVAAAKAALETI